MEGSARDGRRRGGEFGEVAVPWFEEEGSWFGWREEEAGDLEDESGPLTTMGLGEFGPLELLVGSPGLNPELSAGG